MINYFLKAIEKIQNERFQKYVKYVNLLLAFFCLVFIFNFYFINRTEIELNYQTFLYEVILLIFIYFISSKVWSDYMVANYDGTKKDYFYNWSFSRLGRYIPLGIMVISVRINQNLPKNKNSNKILFGLIEEQFLGPIMYLPALCMSLFFGNGITILYWYITFQIIIFIIFRAIYFKINHNSISLLNFPVYYIASLILSVILYTFIATNLELNYPYRLAILYSISASIALLFPGVPAGLGIREAFFFFLSNESGTNIEIIDLMLQVRVVSIVVDLIFGLLGVSQLYQYKRKNV